jgi:hypothetical protein
MEEQGVQRPTQRGPTQATTLVDMPTENVQVAQGLDKECIMQDLGWTKYNDTTNPPMPWVLYIEENKTTACKWVRYNLARPNPHIKGTMGYEKPLYRHDLHTDLKSNPSFNDSHAFHNNHLQIFEPTHKSQGVVDQVLEQMGDVRLVAEVQRFRYWARARQIQRQQLQCIEAALRDTNAEYTTTSHYLAQARGPS